ncbi:meprin A subunit beta-like [Protopterus annectens]|uniref:meprin A subunit beta-like n=1 Tax=Protopterus annectens TaxID=7888 RepID=UPI001CFBB66C|nr:meprin A subunit beta-like [Protopterus annectens]
MYSVSISHLSEITTVTVQLITDGEVLRNNDRNSIIGDKYRWPKTIPYYLEDSLDINAKALILKAFEQYRLKTCIDFKPWEGEKNYISVFKEGGCWSYIGLNGGKQQLSIGANCDRIATIEHEFLHALGFWHEQSRADRDDYVNIIWDRIQSGKESNFNKYSDTQSDSLNVPYDYTSVMHYSKTAFQNGSEPTIVTNIPDFMNVIGQRMEFSDSDLQKLNRLYNCTSSLSFMDQCSFELENICGMIQGSGDNDDWKRVSEVNAGPSTDHTLLGNCKATGYFMHFDTQSGVAGKNAFLESRFLYPKRGFQCLQFYYYNSGNQSDELNIWVREYTSSTPNGILKLIGVVKDQPLDYWQLHHFSMNVANKFRVVFEGVKRSGASMGGVSIDDINLSETKCPTHVWHIRNFTHLVDTSPAGVLGKISSPRFYSSEGYAFQVDLYLNGTIDFPDNIAAFFHLTSGENDDKLQWPCPWKQATMLLLDQNPDIRHRMSNQRSITTDPNLKETEGNSTYYFWDRPDKIGFPVVMPDGTSFFKGPGLGTSAFIAHNRLNSREFVKGNDAFVLISVEDVSHLVASQAKPTSITPEALTCSELQCENEGACIMENNKAVCKCPANEEHWYMGERCEKKGKAQDTIIIAVSSSVSIFVVMLIICSVSLVCLKKKYKKKLYERKEPGYTMENAYVNKNAF